MAPAPVPLARIAQARKLGIETCGRIAKFWGFTPTMGRTFGLLYLNPEALPRTEIQKRLRISAGNASMTLVALQRWGVVQRVRVRGDRRDHYGAETDFWKMISRVLNERERREIRAAIETVRRGHAEARAARRKAGKHATIAAFTADRLGRLLEICQLGETMLDMLLGELTLDVARFRDVFGGAPRQEAAMPRAGTASAAGSTTQRR